MKIVQVFRILFLFCSWTRGKSSECILHNMWDHGRLLISTILSAGEATVTRNYTLIATTKTQKRESIQIKEHIGQPEEVKTNAIIRSRQAANQAEFDTNKKLDACIIMKVVLGPVIAVLPVSVTTITNSLHCMNFFLALSNFYQILSAYSPCKERELTGADILSTMTTNFNR